MPAKITFAGDNTCEHVTSAWTSPKTKKHRDIHNADALGEGGRKCVEDADGRGEPRLKLVIATLGLGTERGDLLSQDGKYGIGRVAGLKPGE